MREAFRRDLKGTGVDPFKCRLHSLPFRGSDYVSLQYCQRYSVSATWLLEVDASHRHICLRRSGSKTFCFQISWALAMQATSFYLTFAQYFVTLYRGGSRQAVPK